MRRSRAATRIMSFSPRRAPAEQVPVASLPARDAGARPGWTGPGDQGGFALIAVTLVLALLGVVVTELAFSMRLETAMVRSYRDGILARQLAEAGVQQAIREIISDANTHGLDEDGQVLFYQAPQPGAKPKLLPRLPRAHVPLGPGEFSYKITDEEARLNVNLRQAGMLERLLMALEVDKQERDIIVDSLEDWRDANDLARINGAESDHYAKLPVPYRPRNGNLQDLAELLQIRGITPEIYYGHDDKPGLVELLTVRTRGPMININTAPKLVLKAIGLADAEIESVVQGRAAQPFSAVPPLFTTRGRFSVTSATFRIEAEGVIAGQPRARLSAIVQRSIGAQTGAAPVVVVYSWQSLAPRTRPKDPETER
jgi:general secretion pathway protein K